MLSTKYIVSIYYKRSVFFGGLTKGRLLLRGERVPITCAAKIEYYKIAGLNIKFEFSFYCLAELMARVN